MEKLLRGAASPDIAESFGDSYETNVVSLAGKAAFNFFIRRDL
jgi:hypothetical protein